MVGFVTTLSASLKLPTFSSKTGQGFISRLKDLTNELNPLKTEVDLREFTTPIEFIKESGNSGKALAALDKFVTDRTGSKMSFLFQDLVEESLSSLNKACQKKKEKLDRLAQGADDVQSHTSTDNESPNLRIEQRKGKNKTRPVNSSIYDFVQVPEPEIDVVDSPEPAQIFKVKKSTFEVFSTLFSGSEARGSINWTSFEAAMADLNFSVVPKFGSVFTFISPEDLTKKYITIHGPHKSRIEGQI